MDELEARIADLQQREELAAIRPDLDGRQVMDHLGIKPSPAVGKALDFLQLSGERREQATDVLLRALRGEDEQDPG